MAKKRILASILASVSALATSMAEKKIKYSDENYETSQSRFVKGDTHGNNLDNDVIYNLGKKGLSTGIKVGGIVGLGLLGTYGLIEGYNKYGNFGQDTKKECTFVENKREFSIKNTQDENWKNDGIYRLNVNNTDFYVCFCESSSENIEGPFALFSQNKDKIKEILGKKDEIKSNSASMPLENPHLKLKHSHKAKRYINSNDEKVSNIVDCIIEEICAKLVIDKQNMNDKSRQAILNSLPQCIQVFSIDTNFAKDKMNQKNSDISIISWQPTINAYFMSEPEVYYQQNNVFKNTYNKNNW